MMVEHVVLTDDQIEALITAPPSRDTNWALKVALNKLQTELGRPLELVVRRSRGHS